MNIYQADKKTEDKPEKMSEQMLIGKKYLESRIVFLWGGVDDDSAKHVIDRLLYLEAEKPGEEISFFINSPGGYVTSGMAIYDTMQMISSPVRTICMGLAASMDLFCYLAERKVNDKFSNMAGL